MGEFKEIKMGAYQENPMPRTEEHLRVELRRGLLVLAARSFCLRVLIVTNLYRVTLDSRLGGAKL